jgi:Putative beta-barrel porin-2, OmpL-like. bbp2
VSLGLAIIWCLAQADAGVATEVAVVTFAPYIETFYQWNFRQPLDGVTPKRAFDAIHNQVSIANAVFDAKVEAGGFTARLALQVGVTPDIYFDSADPLWPEPAGSFDNRSLKFLQQANVGYEFQTLKHLKFEAGVFLSPIGPESIAVKDNFNFSRSNLFYTLPFYHLGGRASVTWLEGVTLTAGLFNGWNSIADNNDEKSISLQLVRIGSQGTLSLLYFGGVERPRDYPERPIRHLFDAHYTGRVHRLLEVVGHASAGFEPRLLSWAGAAVATRFQVFEWLFVSPRVDVYGENRMSYVAATASSFREPSFTWTGTLTLDVRPYKTVSIRLEYRRDDEQTLHETGTAERIENTLTLGVTAWL